MKFGIIANIMKKEVGGIVNKIIEEIKKHNFDFYLVNEISRLEDFQISDVESSKFIPKEIIGEKSDIVISIGGDGTMLNTAYIVRNTSTPLLGVNYGKLGFLAEFDLETFKIFLSEVKERKYVIEERIALMASCDEFNDKLFAINDIVIDKGPWPKMIEITIYIDDEYVTTFMADGIIIATPTGSTGYSLSTGGPIVNPQSEVLTLSPIAPHTLTMRPLVVSSKQKIKLNVNSPFEKIQVSSDGQRVNYFKPPTIIEIEKSSQPVKLVHLSKSNFYEILRSKLYWGLDVRKQNN